MATSVYIQNGDTILYEDKDSLGDCIAQCIADAGDDCAGIAYQFSSGHCIEYQVGDDSCTPSGLCASNDFDVAYDVNQVNAAGATGCPGYGS